MRLARFGAMILLAVLLAPAVYAGPPEAPTTPKLTPPEIDKEWKELQKKGWSKGDMGRALGICQGDREAFKLYKKLAVNDKVPVRLIARSFEICENEPTVATEYWSWVLEHKFDIQEVNQVFAKFPANKQTRWWYFAYRAGGVAGGAQALADRKAKAKNGGAAIEKYPMKECLGVFVQARFDMELTKEYFQMRDEGKPLQEAWPAIKEKIEAQKAEEKKEAEKKAEEQRQKEIEKQKAIELRRKQALEAAEKRMKERGKDDERAQTGTINDLDESLGFLNGDDDDDEGDDKQKEKKEEDEPKEDEDKKKDEEKKDDEA